MVLTTYGRSSGFCIDPVEKKPLSHFLGCRSAAFMRATLRGSGNLRRVAGGAPSAPANCQLPL